MRKLLALVFLSILANAPLQADLDPETRAKLEAAMASEIREETEKQRDPNRLPVETLGYFGLRDDMRVLELFPGTGWYTKLLGPVLRERGKLYCAIMTDRIAPLVQKTPGLDRIELLDVNAQMPMTETRGIFELGELSFWVEDLDMVLTFRNAHNLTPSGRRNLNQAVFDALKSGGIYGVLDHTRRHMEPENADNRRRADPVEIIHEATQTGFEFLGYSELHYQPGDDLRKEVADPSIADRTDRFTLMFRKPL
jgi:predicted methyltransferase